MHVFKPVDVWKRGTGDESEWNRHIQGALKKVKDATKWPCHTRRESRICQKLFNHPAHSLTHCLSFCLALTAILLYQTAIKDSHMSNTLECSTLSNGFVFLERLLRIPIIVFHLICVQGKIIFFGLQHVISCSLFQFLILDLTHQRFKEEHDPFAMWHMPLKIPDSKSA